MSNKYTILLVRRRDLSLSLSIFVKLSVLRIRRLSHPVSTVFFLIAYIRIYHVFLFALYVQSGDVLFSIDRSSSIDLETDRKVQKTILAAFRGKTLLCIAHRLKTVIRFVQLPELLPFLTDMD